MPQSYPSKSSSLDLHSSAPHVQTADSGQAPERLQTPLIERVVGRGRRTLQTLLDLRRRSALQRSVRAPRQLWLEDPACAAALVVVAHPDDEVITAAALLSRVERAGVICVSDGAPRSYGYAESAGLSSRFDLGAMRRREAAAALALIGRDIEPRTNLGVVDQEVACEMVALARYLVGPLQAGFTHVVTHAYEGGHPDHDAVALAVHAAAALVRKSGAVPPTILEAAVYSGAGDSPALQSFLPHPDAGPVISLELTPEERDLKRGMFRSHVTQQRVLSSFKVAQEQFRLAPRYHFSAPPHAGRLGFDRFRWRLTGKTWRKAAWRAIRELGLIDELA
jgi:LmbE family N-acetylglucosaminyl deacetylase